MECSWESKGKLMRLLVEKGMGKLPVFVGGIIPPADVPALKAEGVLEVFGPGTATAEVVRAIRLALGTGANG